MDRISVANLYGADFTTGDKQQHILKHSTQLRSRHSKINTAHT